MARKSKLSDAEKQRWAHIDEIVNEHQDALRQCDHRGLNEFAIEHDFNNRADFGKYKHSLKKIRVDYNALREAGMAEMIDKLEQYAKDSPVLQLWIGAIEDEETETGSFGIADAEGGALWYGDFFNDDEMSIRVPGDPYSAEQEVAHKALYLAGKVRELADEKALQLWLHTTCPELDVQQIRRRALSKKLAVSIHVSESDKALYWAEIGGFKNFKDNSDSALLDLLEREAEIDDVDDENAAEVSQ